MKQKALRKVKRNIRFKRKKWMVEFPLMKASNLDEVAIELKEVTKDIQQALKTTKYGELYEINVEVKEKGYIWWYPVFTGTRRST